eukprot:scaffold3296_cov405-Prasinococcus_capsulatus_cf.AAC.2
MDALLDYEMTEGAAMPDSTPFHREFSMPEMPAEGVVRLEDLESQQLEDYEEMVKSNAVQASQALMNFTFHTDVIMHVLERSLAEHELAYVAGLEDPNDSDGRSICGPLLCRCGCIHTCKPACARARAPGHSFSASCGAAPLPRGAEPSLQAAAAADPGKARLPRRDGLSSLLRSARLGSGRVGVIRGISACTGRDIRAPHHRRDDDAPRRAPARGQPSQAGAPRVVAPTLPADKGVLCAPTAPQTKASGGS